MEFGPILSALKHHKTGTILVALQISVSIAIIVNAMFIINQRVEKMDRETGMDTKNILVTSIRNINEDDDVVAGIAADLAKLRALPPIFLSI